MFAGNEGNRDVVSTTVELSMLNGAVLFGNLDRPRTKRLAEYLNDPGQFIEIELVTGVRVNVCKAAIVTCEVRRIAKADQIAVAERSYSRYRPLEVLGLPATASEGDIREAFRCRTLSYHTGRFEGLDLPLEVVAYFGEMTLRIDSAHSDALSLLARAPIEPVARPADRARLAAR